MTEASFQPSVFWKTCKVCKGKGEVRSCHVNALPAGGRPTGLKNPERTGGCTGEVIAESGRSYCGACMGTGIKVIRETNN
jgi:hypothetical protein